MGQNVSRMDRKPQAARDFGGLEPRKHLRRRPGPMNVLIDTNILGRIVEVGHAQHRVASDAADALRRAGDTLCLVPQVLYEFWVVATRPIAANGLGFPPAQADAELAHVQALLGLVGVAS